MVKYKLYGAILGDIAGQLHEFPTRGTKDAPKLENINIHDSKAKVTDDTYMTLASAKWLLDPSASIEAWYKRIGNEYTDGGYGDNFKEWLKTPLGTPAYSWGNGCLMRISPFMYTKQPLVYAIESVMTSHRSQEAIKSVVDLCSLYEGYEIGGWLEEFKKFEVRADITLKFCNTVWKRAVENEWNTQTAIKYAISKGGDTDTNASIIGEYLNFENNDITEEDVKYVESKLDPYLLSILHEFNKKFADE